MSQIRKVLVILGDGKLLGQQRANIQVFYTLRTKGIKPIFVIGTAKETKEIERHLEELGFEFIRIAFPGLFNRGMGIYAIMRNSFIIIKSNFALIKIIKQDQPDILHLTNEINFRNLYPALLFANKKIIYRIGDAPRQHHLLFRLVWQFIIIPKTHKFVCVSHYIRNILISAGVNEKKTCVIYSYPPVRLNDKNSESLLHCNLRNNYNIVYIGQISEHKGIDLLIDACLEIFKKKNNGTNLIVAGNLDYNDTLCKRLVEKVRASELEERILFLGNVENLEMILNDCNLHICPSIWEEPLSNTIVEAKYFSLPSVIFNSGGLPEIINHKIDGYICKERTVGELIKGISFFACDFEKSKKAGNEAKLSLEILGITPELFCNKWTKIYEI